MAGKERRVTHQIVLYSQPMPGSSVSVVVLAASWPAAIIRGGHDGLLLNKK